MNNEQLESLLRAADESSPFPDKPLAGLADRVRSTFSRRQVRRRRIKLVGGLASCYIAGMLTMWSVFSFRSTGQVDVAGRPTSTSNVPEEFAESLVNTKLDQDVLTPSDHQHALIEPDPITAISRYELLRRLGDECHQRNDFQGAVAHYKNALDAATDAELGISFAQDDWLLVSLKKDRIAAQQHTTTGDSI